MKNKIKTALLMILRFVPLILCAVLMCAYLFSDGEITAEKLLDFAPENPIYAAVFLVLLYAFKSLTVFFPIIVLNVLGGFLFDPPLALLINCVGVLVELAVPYGIGRVSGRGFADKLCEKHPKLAKIVVGKVQNQSFLAFLLRALFCLPGDAISMYFGAIKMPFHKYLSSSFLGILPGTVASTLIGTSITDPSSPLFWISIGLTVGFAGLSFFVYYLWKRAKNKPKDL